MTLGDGVSAHAGGRIDRLLRRHEDARPDPSKTRPRYPRTTGSSASRAERKRQATAPASLLERSNGAIGRIASFVASFSAPSLDKHRIFVV
jgi:hypothetical protein